MMLAVLSVTSALAAGSLVEQGNAAYGTEHYNKALELYLKAEKTQGISSDLCYNIGNTYYRLKDTVNAVVYYERALILDPSNDDARNNLDFTRERAQINENSGDTYFTSHIASMASSMSSNTWAVIAIVSFIMMLLAVAAYMFLDNVLLRKMGFFGGIALLVVCVIANVCAFYVHGKAVDRNTAIIKCQVKASTAPRVPKDKSEVAFEIKAGYKVTINDSVTSGDSKWLDVETNDSRRGWINANDIEII